jgi:PucR C-terminal helix-turn-helix domain
MDDGSVLADQRFRRLGLRRMLTRRDSRAATTVARESSANSMTWAAKKKMSSSTPSWRGVPTKGSADNAAAQLHVHPNTARHRLRRIEANIGRSLAVPDELAELCLACEIRENMPAP